MLRSPLLLLLLWPLGLLKLCTGLGRITEKMCWQCYAVHELTEIVILKDKPMDKSKCIPLNILYVSSYVISFILHRRRNSLTQWNRALLQKLIDPQLVKKFTKLYKSQRFITLTIPWQWFMPILINFTIKFLNVAMFTT